MNPYKNIYRINLDDKYKNTIITGNIFNCTDESQLNYPEQLHGEYWCFKNDNSGFSLFRDKIGICPCYYYFRSPILIVSSHLEGLIQYLKDLDIKLTFNSKYAKSILNENFKNQEKTLINEIQRCPPGFKINFLNKNNCWISFSQKYWKPILSIDSFSDTSREPSHRNNNQKLYEASNLYNLIERITSDRIRYSKKIGLFLSGGLDSSILYYFLSQQDQEKWKSYSIDFDSQTIAYEKNLKFHTKNVDKIYWNPSIMNECLASNAIWPFSTLYSPGLGLFLPLFRNAKNDVISTIWTGLGGDDYFTFPELHSTKNYFLKSLYYLKNIFNGIEGSFSQMLLRNRIEYSGNYGFGIECEQQIAISHDQIMSYPLLDDRIYNWILLNYSLDMVDNKNHLRVAFNKALPTDIAAFRSEQDLKFILNDLIANSYPINKEKDFSYSDGAAILNPFLEKMREEFDEKNH